MKEETRYDLSAVNNMLQGNAYKLMHQKFRFYHTDEIHSFYMHTCTVIKCMRNSHSSEQAIKFTYLKPPLLDYIKDLRNKKNGQVIAYK